MPRRRLFMRDALGRIRPKYGATRRYARRAAHEAHDAELWGRRADAARASRVIVYRPDRVNLHFATSPNRPPGHLKVKNLKRRKRWL